MKCEDHRAENLLLRVASYTPRVGRDAEEDFCTEVLAWCLLHCVRFRETFLGLLRQKLPLGNSADCPRISTQEVFQPDQGAEEGSQPLRSGESGGGRFDLVLEHPDNSSWVIVIECKVHYDAGLAAQLLRYKEALQRPDSRFRQFKQKYVATLTASSGFPSGSVAHLSWPVVQRELEMVSARRTPRRVTGPSDKLAELICAQFADFLKQKGLAFMKLTKYSADRFKHWVEGMEFRDQLERILLAVREEPKLKRLLKGRAELRVEENGTRCLEIESRIGMPYLCIGFTLMSTSGAPLYKMFVQGRPQVARPTDKPHYHWKDASGTCFGFECAIIGTTDDGQAEHIKGWFLEKVRNFVELGTSEPVFAP